MITPKEFKDKISALLKTEEWEIRNGPQGNGSKYNNSNFYSLLAMVPNSRFPGKMGREPATSLQTISSWEMIQLPGCCGVMVSTGVYVNEKYRRIGLGSILNELRMHEARRLGYTVLLCTDVTDNAPQVRILEKNGWTSLLKFKNRRTRNEVSINAINLYKE